jgi:hypothetical protein
MDCATFILDCGVSCVEEISYISVFSGQCDKGCEESVFNWLRRINKLLERVILFLLVSMAAV